MKALGQVADDQGSALHNLDASSQQLTTFFDQLGPFADASRPAFRSLGSASKTGDRAVKAAPPVIAQLGAFSAGTPELGKNLSIVLRAPRRPQARRREGPAQPRRPGLHGPRGAAAVRLRPDDLDVDLRPEQPHPQDRRLRRAVRRLRQRGDAEEGPEPRAPVRLAPGPDPARPQLPRRDQARDARTRPRDRGARKRADGDHGLPLPAVPAPVEPAAGAGDARRARDAVARRGALHADGPDADRAGRCRPSTCRRCPAPAAATTAAAPRRCRRCRSSARRPAATRRPRPGSSTTCSAHEARAADPTPRSSPTPCSSGR